MANGITPVALSDAAKDIVHTSIATSERKVQLSLGQMLVLGMLAGVYIGFGAELMTMVTNDLAKYVGTGLTQFIGGAVFSVGLMLVVLAGAELFTGNCLVITGALEGRVTWGQLLYNWIAIWIFNLLGSLLLVYIYYYSGLWKVNGALVGARAVSIAAGKVNLSWAEAFFRGIGCNWLVCLAVWMAFASRDYISKIFSIFFPIMAFVASGFEHSIANMYFIPIGILLQNQPAVAQVLTAPVTNLTWSAFFINNLIPVTLGNIVGGALFVGAVYWTVYARGTTRAQAPGVTEAKR